MHNKKEPLKNRFSLRNAHTSCEHFESATKPYQVPIRKDVFQRFQKGHAEKLVAIVLIAAAVFISLAGCLRSRGPAAGPVSLTIYGLDDSDVFDPLIVKYRESHPAANVKYKKFNDPAAFENLLVNEIAEGEGPDIFYIHNTWLPRHIKKIVPLVSEAVTPQVFSEKFVNVTTEDFIQPDPKDGVKKIYALPVYTDTLALYYNKEMFEQKIPERGKPASNWEVFKEDAAKMRQESEDGRLEQGIIALGRSDNISLASDILYNLFLQSGVQLYDAEFKQVQVSSGEGQKAFDYFMGFADRQNKNYSWAVDSAAPTQAAPEVEAFLSGKTASILAYSDLYPRLATELKNVQSRFSSSVSLNDIGIMPIPQMSADETAYKVWANYYGLAVSRNSKNPNAAWEFIQFAVSKDNAKLYHQKTKRPAARRDLIEEQKKEPYTDVFVSQLGYAGSYRVFSDQKFADYLKEAAALANGGVTSREALLQAQGKMNELLKTEAPAEGLYPKPKVKKK